MMMRLWRARFVKQIAVAPSLAASAIVHAALIAGAVVLTERSAAVERPLPPNSIARFLAPPNRVTSPRATVEVIRYVALGAPDAVLDDAARAGELSAGPQPVRAAEGALVAAPAPAPSADSVFSLLEVDSATYRYEWSAAPVFPPAMLQRGQEGLVRAEWVVDETGLADTSTFVVLEATNAEFEQAVRDALPHMRFRPAMIGATPVRQLVEQPFHFRIAGTTADTTRATRPRW